MKRYKDLVGKRFGKLVVVSSTEERKRKYMVWLCKCDCGEYTKVDTGHLNKYTIACGCVRKNPLPQGEASFTDLFHSYRKNAKKRGYLFNLTRKQFRKLTSQNCNYCGRVPSQLHNKEKFNENYIYNGIDRVDNSKGYDIKNCVPCCKICNRAKDVMPKDDFIAWIIAIATELELRL